MYFGNFIQFYCYEDSFSFLLLNPQEFEVYWSDKYRGLSKDMEGMKVLGTFVISERERFW